MNTVPGPDSHATSSGETRNAILPHSAERQLDALRAAIEVRLAALEAALADPARGHALESLILDLARLATEEAQAAASRACVGMKLEADTELANARAAAQAAAEREHAATGDLRRAVEQAHQRLATLEREKDATSRTLAEVTGHLEVERAAHDASATELAQARRLAADHQRGLAETQQRLEAEQATSADLRGILVEAQTQLEAERGANAELRQSLADIDQRLATLRDHGAQIHASHEALAADLVRERQLTVDLRDQHAQMLEAQEVLEAELAGERRLAADLRRAHAETQSQLEAERALSAGLRGSVEQIEQRLSSVVDGAGKTQESHKEIERDLGVARSEVEALRAELEAARKRLDELDAERAGVERARGEAEAQAEALARERDTLARELETERERSSLSRETQREADAIEVGADEDGWVPVRLASRYAFNAQIAIQVNGGPGQLCDLSVSGCQLLSSTPLEPSQAVELRLPAEPTPIVCVGEIVWARRQPSVTGQPLDCRAGVRFTAADGLEIEAFVIRHAAL